MPAASPSDASAQPPPAATFLVRGIFILGTRSLFIVRGTVASGSVRAKQRILAPAGMDAEVQSVEANLLDVNGGSSQTALTFHYAKLAQLDRWKAAVVEGTLLSLGDPAR
jgi:sulfate adenylyltransferase subunit 1 (EFTu-like GTPase family)